MTALTHWNHAFDLTDDQRRIVREVISQILPHADVWIFGSRATGRARPFSDLDVLVRSAERLAWEQRIKLSDAFEQSELPFRVDIVEIRSLEGPVLQRVWQEARVL